MSEEHIAVCAIDFGTTFSGWAISFRTEYDENPSKVYAKNWSSGENMSPKTPTTVLIRPDGNTLEAFGYEAENKYAQLAAKKQHLQYYYFKRFKLLLYKEQNISPDTRLEAENGRSLPAILVFQLAIKYLKDDLLSGYKERLDDNVPISVSDIHWAITVPAMWSDSAKVFMRQAAVKAGIPGYKLTIVLEPEAAAVYCQYQPLQRSNTGQLVTLEPGTKYALIDCGGGTIDICCHEVAENHSMKEITRTNGGPIGGTKIDESFEMLLIRIVGAPVMMQFRKECPDDYLSLFRVFEVKKREHSLSADCSMSISLPLQLVHIFEASSGEKLAKALENVSFGKDVELHPGNKLTFSSGLIVNELYGKHAPAFRKLLKKVFTDPSMKGVGKVLLVGGFGESKIVHAYLKADFPDIRVIKPPDASLAVVKGAVIYTHNERIVTERVARFTYSKRNAVLYDPNIHSQQKVRFFNKKQYVEILRPLVKAGERLPRNHQVDGGINTPGTEDQEEVTFPLYATEDDQMTYLDDPKCIKLGAVTVPITDMSVPQKERRFSISYMFGGTEIVALVTELRNNRVTWAKFEFLG